MSGHKTYDCEHDRKPNLRAICISTMSDRAFNAYTEFYTHTLNMCWFLKGQIWQEKISENTWKVGQQLELTAYNQDNLLKAQQESLELQEKMLKHGKSLENVLESLHEASNIHQNILMMLSKSVANLQTWIMGEVSWIDSVVFYMVSVFVTFLLTSSERTLSSRIPISVLLFFNLLLERMICSYISSESEDINILTIYLKIYDFVWYSRYAFICLAFITFLYNSVYHKDIHLRNNEILQKIYNQNAAVLISINYLKLKLGSEANGVVENSYVCNEKSFKECENECNLSTEDEKETKNRFSFSRLYSKDKIIKMKPLVKQAGQGLNGHYTSGSVKKSYNLRSSRQSTPDC